MFYADALQFLGHIMGVAMVFDANRALSWEQAAPSAFILVVDGPGQAGRAAWRG